MQGMDLVSRTLFAARFSRTYLQPHCRSGDRAGLQLTQACHSLAPTAGLHAGCQRDARHWHDGPAVQLRIPLLPVHQQHLPSQARLLCPLGCPPLCTLF